LAHPYLRFRILLARHGVARLAARLRGSAEIAAMVLGPAVIGLIAFAAMPAMLAASHPLPLALPLLILHGIAMSLPILLLRPQVLPAHALPWMAGLPVAPRQLLQASMLVAALLAAPLALAYVASLAIWLTQRPAWISPARAAGGTALSFLLTWACGAWLLARGVRAPLPPGKRPGKAVRGPRPAMASCGTACSGWRSGARAATRGRARRCCWQPAWPPSWRGCWGQPAVASKVEACEQKPQGPAFFLAQLGAHLRFI
jgi:hypothetical protein